MLSIDSCLSRRQSPSSDRHSSGHAQGGRWVAAWGWLCAMLLLLPAPAMAMALDWKDDARIGALFQDAGVTGTFVLHDVQAERFVGHDATRAQTGYFPASTFKIANSLIGLEYGAVTGVDQVLPYGGKPQMFEEWEQDMSLREGIAVSNVPVFQELARRIGLSRMRQGVRSLDYGDRRIGTTVDQFWLTGPLRISAVEQTRFLGRLASGRLPFRATVQAQVRQIVLLERGQDAQGVPWTLYGKTGWVFEDPQIGWWVGWVEKQGRLYAFALNIDVREEGDLAKRVPVGRAALEAAGIL